MKLFVFLGNPGLKYRKTRHNIGFMAGDFFAKKLGVKWKFEKKFDADVARDGSTLLVKPQLFYNRTGEVVRKLMNFYKIDISDLVVVCDDLNLDFGVVRQREKGSDGGNNGLESIIQQIGSKFTRIRIGTNNDLREKMDNATFVLNKLSKEEQQKLPEILETTLRDF
jgi:peptidyl-tRNA hydrolase